MAKKRLNTRIVGNTVQVDDLLADLLESSPDYSIIGNDLKGKIFSWNEGARRLYGYEPGEVIGKSSDLLYTPEEVQAGLPQQIMKTALDDGRWEGTITRVRRDGAQFSAHTREHAAAGRQQASPSACCSSPKV